MTHGSIFFHMHRRSLYPLTFAIEAGYTYGAEGLNLPPLGFGTYETRGALITRPSSNIVLTDSVVSGG